MGQYILHRLIQSVPLLLIVSVIIFGLIHVTPGDPVRIMMGNDSNPILEQAIRHQLHLDEPIYTQYVQWLNGLVHANLGKSIRTQLPVATLLADRLPTTLSLALVSMILALAVAIPSGAIAAAHRNSFIDYGSMLAATVTWSVPDFVVAVLLVVVVGVGLQWLPISGSGNLFSDPLGSWRYLLMPTVALGLSRAAVMTRMLRSSILEELRRDYVRTATAKGLVRRRVLARHVLRNALTPVVTVAAINFGYLLGGTVVVEQIFGLSGIGSLLVGAVFARDFPVIQGVTFVAAATFITVNLAADVAYGALNPRIRYA